MDKVKAIDELFLFRIQGEEGNAWKIAFQTDASTDETRNYDTEPTKDGSITTAGAYEATHSLTAFLAVGDTYVKDLKELLRAENPGKLEVWEVDRTTLEEGTTISGDYSIDYVTNVNSAAGSEGNVEISIETQVDGNIIAGEINVTAELITILQKISATQTFEQPTTDTP